MKTIKISDEFYFHCEYSFLTKLRVKNRVRSKKRTSNPKYYCEAYNVEEKKWERYGCFNKQTLLELKYKQPIK